MSAPATRCSAGSGARSRPTGAAATGAARRTGRAGRPGAGERCSTCSWTGWSTTGRGPPRAAGGAAGHGRSGDRCRAGRGTGRRTAGPARRGLAADRRPWLTDDGLDRRPSCDGSTACVTALRGRGRRDRHDRARRRARPGPAGASPWCPTTTCASCAPTRSSQTCPRRSPGSTRARPLTWISGPSRDQRHRARTGSRACTARARSRSCSSASRHAELVALRVGEGRPVVHGPSCPRWSSVAPFAIRSAICFSGSSVTGRRSTWIRFLTSSAPAPAGRGSGPAALPGRPGG